MFRLSNIRLLILGLGFLTYAPLAHAIAPEQAVTPIYPYGYGGVPTDPTVQYVVLAGKRMDLLDQQKVATGGIEDQKERVARMQKTFISETGETLSSQYPYAEVIFPSAYEEAQEKAREEMGNSGDPSYVAVMKQGVKRTATYLETINSALVVWNDKIKDAEARKRSREEIDALKKTPPDEVMAILRPIFREKADALCAAPKPRKPVAKSAPKVAGPKPATDSPVDNRFDSPPPEAPIGDVPPRV